MKTQKRSARTGLAAGVLVLALGMTACSKAADEPVETTSTAVVAGKTIDLDEAADGTTVQAAAGDKILLTLGSNPSTGYAWEVTTEPDAAVLKVDPSKYNEPDSDAIGAGGTEVWHMTAVGAGTTTLMLTSVPPGRILDDVILATFTVTVKVG